MRALGEFRPTPWETYTYDANDLADLTHHGLPAATAVAAHWYTPQSAQVDALGRVVRTVDRLEPAAPGGPPVEVLMQYAYDLRGNRTTVIDALGRTSFRHVYDLKPKAGEDAPGANVLRTAHLDGGVRLACFDGAGPPLQGRDAKGALTLHAYDELGRPTDAWARDRAGEDVTRRQHLAYGGLTATPTNSVGQLLAHYDEAGLMRLLGYDFKGNLLEKERQVVADAVFTDQWAASANPGGSGLPWQALPAGFNRHWEDLADPARLAPTVYQTSTQYDALNRATQLTLPAEATGTRPQLVPSYNRAGALAQVRLDGQVLVEQVAYNARGQRLLLARGNGLMTRYAYDPTSFRLLRLCTEGYLRTADTFTPQGSVRQDTAYRYDLAGNITATTEYAPESGVGGADKLERLFEYDALYRLIAATGRENQPTAATPWQDATRSDGVATTTAYIQRYAYDQLGNILSLAHTAAPSRTSFTRTFAYAPPVLVGPGGRIEQPNYLLDVKVGGTLAADYAYDANGNVLHETQSRHLGWDAADQLRQFATWTGPRSSPTLLAYYVYDASGARAKKLTQTSTNTWQVTVYVDGIFEHRYEFSNGNQTGEQTTLFVLDGRSRLFNRRAGDNLGDLRPVELFTLEDHLGSATLTVDAYGSLVSREEYYPFGETSFGSHMKQCYRFCGKERDIESGLYYYGMRYYLPWVCRFVSVDPLAEDYPFFTPYQYAGNKPIISIDIDGMEGNNENNQTAIPARAENITLNGVNVASTDMPVRKPISIHLNTANKLFPSNHLDNSVFKTANDATFVKQVLNRPVLPNGFSQLLQEDKPTSASIKALSNKYGAIGVAGTSIFSEEFKNRPSAAYENASMTGTYIGLSATGTGLFRLMGLGTISARGFQNIIQQYVTKGFKLDKIDAADTFGSMAGARLGSVALDVGFGSLVDLTLEKGLKVAPFNKSLQEVRIDAASKLLQRNMFTMTPQTENPLIFLAGRAATTEAASRLKKASAQQKH